MIVAGACLSGFLLDLCVDLIDYRLQAIVCIKKPRKQFQCIFNFSVRIWIRAFPQSHDKPRGFPRNSSIGKLRVHTLRCVIIPFLQSFLQRSLCRVCRYCRVGIYLNCYVIIVFFGRMHCIRRNDERIIVPPKERSFSSRFSLPGQIGQIISTMECIFVRPLFFCSICIAT